MNRKSEEIKEKQISEVMASIENRVRHAYNQGYEQGLEAGREQTMTREQALKLLMDIVQDLPSVTQEPKNGHWIAEKKYPPLSDAQITVYRCSCCDLHFDFVSNYCPTCGAKMEMRIRNDETK